MVENVRDLADSEGIFPAEGGHSPEPRGMD
jgi:hypothetical protein